MTGTRPKSDNPESDDSGPRQESNQNSTSSHRAASRPHPWQEKLNLPHHAAGPRQENSPGHNVDKLRGLCIRLSGRHSTKTTETLSLEIPDPRKSFSPPQRNSTPSRWSGGISVIVSFCIVDQKIQSLTRVSDRDVARHTKNGCGRGRHPRHPIFCMSRDIAIGNSGQTLDFLIHSGSRDPDSGVRIRGPGSGSRGPDLAWARGLTPVSRAPGSQPHENLKS